MANSDKEFTSDEANKAFPNRIRPIKEQFQFLESICIKFHGALIKREYGYSHLGRKSEI